MATLLAGTPDEQGSAASPLQEGHPPHECFPEGRFGHAVGVPSASPFLEGLRAGDDAARERLVREHAPRMLAVARRLLRCEHDAADALQDAFLSAFHGAPAFTGQASLATWLHRITVNACLMSLRARARHPAASLDQLLPAFDESRQCPYDRDDADGCRHAAAHETCLRVRACIDRLPAAYRAVLLLRDIEGFDTAETAARLRCTPSNIKTRLHRARRALRALLEQSLPERPD